MAKPLLNGDPLFAEVFRRAAVIRCRCNGSCRFDIQLSAFGVRLGDRIRVLIDTGDHVVDIVLGNIRVRDQDCADSYSVDIAGGG